MVEPPLPFHSGQILAAYARRAARLKVRRRTPSEWLLALFAAALATDLGLLFRPHVNGIGHTVRPRMNGNSTVVWRLTPSPLTWNASDCPLIHDSCHRLVRSLLCCLGQQRFDAICRHTGIQRMQVFSV